MKRPLRSSARAPTVDASQDAHEADAPSRVWAMAPPASSSLRGLALIYRGAATLGVAGSLLPHAHSAHGPMRWAMIGAVYVLGTVLWMGRSRLPGVAVDAALAVGVGIVTLALALNGPQSPQYSQIWYVWAALSAAFLLPPRRAGLQLGFIGAAYGGYLVSADVGLKIAIHTWLVTVGTASLATVLVGLLKQRVQRLIEHVAETAKRHPRTGLLNGSGFQQAPAPEPQRAQRADGEP